MEEAVIRHRMAFTARLTDLARQAAAAVRRGPRIGRTATVVVFWRWHPAPGPGAGTSRPPEVPLPTRPAPVARSWPRNEIVPAGAMPAPGFPRWDGDPAFAMLRMRFTKGDEWDGARLMERRR
ncbi:hypothetical protein FRACA_130049 [Frankia canadensis]|uniref:Uncharacterized protein n=1 Tax=Frankia canadensis TaxID=1836972 RepID=A0A2I2KKQ5_9ACTN|nr:hypothetical protein FRACA_130049 [Frankia canadensis]SOU53514.1 hypothetical protein FRACA_130049 [Frankia canadensis]